MKLSSFVAKTFVIGVLLVTPVLAFAEATSLDAIEQKLFARTYSEEAMEDRLSRVEKVTFGDTQTGDTASRTAHIQSIFDKNQPAVKKARPEEGPLTETHPLAPKVKDATDYPAITDLEQKVFGANHRNEDVTGRLERLEKQVFQKTFEEMPLVDRVDQLTLKVFPDGALAREENVSPNLPEKGSDLASGSLEVYSQLTTLEEQTFGQSYGGQMLSVRLARLEQKAFGSAKKGSVDSRLDKLMAWFQRANAGYANQTNRGAFTRPSGGLTGVPRSGYNNNKPYVPQITMGQVMGAQGYSQEMMGMLPPALQQQMTSGASLPGGPVQVYKGPKTWSTQTEVIAPPPSQLPPRTLQPSAPPTLPQPYSVAQQQQMRMQQQQQQQQMQLGNVYGPTMSPQDFNRSLSMLEVQLFGRAYYGGNLMERLNNLEMQVFGAISPRLPPQTRLNLLLQHVPSYRQG